MRSLSLVGEGVDDSKLVWSDRPPAVQQRLVGLGVLRKVVASVKNALDVAQIVLPVISEVLEVEGHPASVDQDGLWFFVVIQVGVEWSHDLNSLLAIVDLVDLDLFAMVEIALESDWLPSPLSFE